MCVYIHGVYEFIHPFLSYVINSVCTDEHCLCRKLGRDKCDLALAARTPWPLSSPLSAFPHPVQTPASFPNSLCLQPLRPLALEQSWKWKVKVKAAQQCPTLCDPMDYSVHGILQARILEWVAFPSPEDLPNPGIKPRSLHHRWTLYPLSHKGSPEQFWKPPNLASVWLCFLQFGWTWSLISFFLYFFFFTWSLISAG